MRILTLLISLGLFLSTYGQRAGFTENKGQWPSEVQFQVQRSMLQVWLTDFGLRTTLMDTASYHATVSHEHHKQHYKKMDNPKLHFAVYDTRFVGGDFSSIEKHHPSAYPLHFYKGKTASHARDVYSYKQLLVKNLYPAIDLAWKYAAEGLKYDVYLRPGHDVSHLQIEYDGVEELYVEDGKLIIETAVGRVEEHIPKAYYEGEPSIPLACEFVVKNNTMGFAFPNGYDPSKTVVIDPSIVFSSLTGSFADNFGYTATYDANGNAYAAGSVFDVGYPTTTGAFDVSFNGNEAVGLTVGTDIGITKFSADGSTILYSAYLGGSRNELPHSLIVNEENDLLLFGTTSSRDFPTSIDAFDNTFNGGATVEFRGLNIGYTGADIIVSKLSEDGSNLLASTYVGGSENDGLNSSGPLTFNYADEVRGEIINDASGNIYVAASTESSDFPITPNAFQPTANGQQDGVLFKMDGELTTMIWSTYLGGSDDDGAYAMALDENEHIVVAGGTRSPDFPVLNAFQPTYGGGRADGFVAKVHRNGEQLLHSTFYGENTYDQIYFTDLGRDDSVHVIGQTLHTGSYFNANASYGNPGAGQFISKFNADVSTRDWSTTFGNATGQPDISPTAFLVDVCNQIYVAGWGGNTNGFGGTSGLDVTADALQSTTDNSDFYLLVIDGDANALQYATFFGDPIAEEHVDGGTSRFNREGVVYQAVCAGCRGNAFPIFPDAASVAAPNNNSPNCNLGILKFDLDVALALADFSFPVICAPRQVSPTNNSSFTNFTNVEFTWRVNDSITYSGFEPPIDFPAPGTYTIELLAVDSITCNVSDSLTRTLVVLGGGARSVLDTLYRCEPGSEQLGPTGIPSDPNLTFAWTPSAPLSTNDVVNPIATVDSSTTFQLIISNGACTDTFLQTVLLSPPNLSITGDTAACRGNPFTLSASAFSNASYQWEPAAAVVSGQGTETAELALDTSQQIRVTMNLQGCIVRDTVGISIDTLLPQIEAFASVDSVLSGEAFTLRAETPEQSVAWQPAGVLDNPSSFTPLAQINETTTFRVETQNQEGCLAFDTVRVKVYRRVCEDNVLYVPNAFSPNGDGDNDVFRARGIFDYDAFYLAVYDRWGQLMFETEDPEVGWDGTYDGRILNPAVFAWYINGVCDGGETFQSKGNVTLLR